MSAMQLSDREFAQFQAMMYEMTGVHLADSKKAMVVSRLAKRLSQLGLSSFDSYYRRIVGGDPGELQRALDLLTTHETYFFREPRHFDTLVRQVLPLARPGAAFRVWSAASSTGEEAYSLAMVLMDRFGPQAAWEVLGSDISVDVIERARTGVFGMERIDGLPQAYLRRFCRRGIGSREGTLLIERSLRSRVRFTRVNLNERLGDVGEFDVVFLRNVLIYFDQPTKQAVVRRVARQLKPGGWFFIGHSESLNGIDAGLQLVQPTVYRKVKA